MSEHLDGLGDVAIVIVVFGSRSAVGEYRNYMAIPFPIVIDEDRVMYRRFGLTRGSLWAVWGPSNLAAYVRLLARRRKLRRPTEADLRQMGGDFVFDREGGLAAAFRPKDPDDRPSIDELSGALQSL